MGLESRWNEEVAAALVEAGEELPETRRGKMFGHPALYARLMLADSRLDTIVAREPDGGSASRRVCP